MAKRATFADTFKMDSFLEAKGNIKSINNPDDKPNRNDNTESMNTENEDIRNSAILEIRKSAIKEPRISVIKDMSNTGNADIRKSVVPDTHGPAVKEISGAVLGSEFSTKQSVSLSLDLYDAWNLYKSQHKRRTGKSLSFQAYIDSLLRENLKDYLP